MDGHQKNQPCDYKVGSLGQPNSREVEWGAGDRVQSCSQRSINHAYVMKLQLKAMDVKSEDLLGC